MRSRAQFGEFLRREGRRTLLEVGTGPGVDAAWFLQGGFQVAGVDLSPVAVQCCVEAGVDARVGSVLHLPFEDGSFDALWSMSTLLHVPDSDIDRSVGEMVRVCRPGAPVVIGVWAGDDTEGRADFDVIEPPRFFSFRSRRRLAEVLEAHLAIEDFQEWPPLGDDGLVYHRVQLRTP